MRTVFDSRDSSLEKEIDRLCESPAFSHSPAQTKLLRYLAQEVLAGRGSQLNQRQIAVRGLDAGENFDPSKNSIVRVQGRRLRQMLEAYYEGPGSFSSVRVRLPERSFCLVFEKRVPIAKLSGMEAMELGKEGNTVDKDMLFVWKSYAKPVLAGTGT